MEVETKSVTPKTRKSIDVDTFRIIRKEPSIPKNILSYKSNITEEPLNNHPIPSPASPEIAEAAAQQIKNTEELTESSQVKSQMTPTTMKKSASSHVIIHSGASPIINRQRIDSVNAANTFQIQESNEPVIMKSQAVKTSSNYKNFIHSNPETQSRPLPRVMSATTRIQNIAHYSKIQDIDEQQEVQKALKFQDTEAKQDDRPTSAHTRRRSSSASPSRSRKFDHQPKEALDNMHISLVRQINALTIEAARIQCRNKYSCILVYIMKLLYRDLCPADFTLFLQMRKNELRSKSDELKSLKQSTLFYKDCNIEEIWQKDVHRRLFYLLDNLGIEKDEFMRIADFVEECNQVQYDNHPLSEVIKHLREWQKVVIGDFVEGNWKDLGIDLFDYRYRYSQNDYEADDEIWKSGIKIGCKIKKYLLIKCIYY